MRIRDLINMLEDLYDEEMKNYDVMGEPEIAIDVFSINREGDREYAGIHLGDIKIDRTADGVYPVLTAFAEAYDIMRKEYDFSQGVIGAVIKNDKT